MPESIGQRFVTSAAFKERRVGNREDGPSVTLADVDVKTLMSTGAGWAVDDLRTPGREYVPAASRPVQVTDLLTEIQTIANSFPYLEETTYTNAAAETAESVQATAGTYPEAALALTERTSPVRKVAVWIPVTEEMLEDDAAAAGYLDARLPFMLRQRLDLQVLVGNGTAPNLRGILNTSGIQTQAKGTDSVPVALRKGITKTQLTPAWAVANAIVLHPTDFEDIDVAAAVDLLAPYMAGGQLWRLPPIASDAITLGTALVGDFANAAALVMRRGIELQVSNSHADYFTSGKVAIRADVRVALPVYRPAAFCVITGI